MVYDEKNVHGYTCKVLYDMYPESPHDMFDQLGIIYSNHRNYNPCNHTIDEILVEDEDGNRSIDSDYIYVPIYCYEHGGITLSTSSFSCPWDSGMFGVMACEKSKAEKEFGDLSNKENLEKALECLRNEVEVWDLYYTGQVFELQVLDENDAVVECICGYYGNPEEVMEEAVDIANHYHEKEQKEIAEEEARIQKYETICEPFWID